MPSRLWFSPATLPSLRRRARRGWFRDVAAAAEAFADENPPEERDLLHGWIEASALSHALSGRAERGRRTGEVALAMLRGASRSDLGRAAQAQAGAIAYDLCAHAWTPALRNDVAAELIALATRLAGTDLSSDNPDNPFNNWWGVTHSAAGLAALCVESEHPEARPLLALSRDRVRTYLLNYGDRGHYYEGTGYGCYALSHWGPYALAERQRGEFDPLALAPGAAWFGVGLAAMTVPRPQLDDESERPDGRLGRRILWNDDSGGWPGGGVGALAAAFAPESFRPGLRWLLDRLDGPLGDRNALARGRGLLWTLLYTPDDLPAASANAAPALPRFLHDQRTGLVLFRNRYRDADDTVVGLYAKTYHGGGHTHEDMGSWRWQGLGGGWAQGGGQAKPEAVFQCVVRHNGKPNLGRHGQISYLTPAADGSGGSVSFRLGPSAGVRMLDRHFLVDFSGASGADTLVAVLDQCLDDDEASTWTWSLCFERHLDCTLEAGGRGFTLRDPLGGATCRATLLAPGDATFSLHEGPATERRFSEGTVRQYPGARYLTATARGRRAEFFVVFTQQRGTAPVAKGIDAGTAVIGDALVRLPRGKWYQGPLRLETQRTSNLQR